MVIGKWRSKTEYVGIRRDSKAYACTCVTASWWLRSYPRWNKKLIRQEDQKEKEWGEGGNFLL